MPVYPLLADRLALAAHISRLGGDHDRLHDHPATVRCDVAIVAPAMSCIRQMCPRCGTMVPIEELASESDGEEAIRLLRRIVSPIPVNAMVSVRDWRDACALIARVDGVPSG